MVYGFFTNIELMARAVYHSIWPHPSPLQRRGDVGWLSWKRCTIVLLPGGLYISHLASP